ncbi:MAG TPA: TonB family protein [Allosphingosinicella sp.]|nr:TonB family protein [Allosphingosinicella sp.]
MMEGAYYQPKKTSPTALAIVVLMHGAGLTALALAKSEVFSDPRIPPTIIDFVKEPPPPPPNDPVEAKPPPSVVTHVPPVIEMPPRPVIAPTEPLPPVEPGPVAQSEPAPLPVPLPRADPPPIREIKPARAKANLASYVSDADYPSAAARNEEQGTTRFKLAVGPDGRVKDCTVTSSSGSSALDSTTCKLMRQRAKFQPATGRDGKPTSDTFASAIRWVLPSD